MLMQEYFDRGWWSIQYIWHFKDARAIKYENWFSFQWLDGYRKNKGTGFKLMFL